MSWDRLIDSVIKQSSLPPCLLPTKKKSGSIASRVLTRLQNYSLTNISERGSCTPGLAAAVPEPSRTPRCSGTGGGEGRGHPDTAPAAGAVLGHAGTLGTT